MGCCCAKPPENSDEDQNILTESDTDLLEDFENAVTDQPESIAKSIDSNYLAEHSSPNLNLNSRSKLSSGKNKFEVRFIKCCPTWSNFWLWSSYNWPSQF